MEVSAVIVSYNSRAVLGPCLDALKKQSAMILSDMIFIDRKNTASAKESLTQAASLVKKGKHVVIFPEGTASKTGKVMRLKKEVFTWRRILKHTSFL